jgi:2-desacetyl-2-hydroxyethyl bacteriochlorophyllide A dehydrogenase
MPGEIPDRMRAVVCHGPGDYRLEEVPTPRAGRGEVLVEVPACGVCASDSKCHAGAPVFWGDEHREPFVDGPVVPGHEFVGRVVELGEGAGERHGVEVGDIVVPEQIVPCWECRYCRKGQYWLCQVHNILGFQRAVHGGMAEYALLPERALIHGVPEGIPPSRAAMIEPLACSIHAVERGHIELGDVLVIAGAGTLGLGMIGAARLKSPSKIVSLDLLDYRLDIAKSMGADIVINPSREDPIERVLSLTDGYGCDVYIEATGHPQAVIQGLHMIKKLGTFVEFSLLKEPVTADWTIIGDQKELNVRGAHLSPYTFPTSIDLISRGLVDVDRIVTHVMALEEYREAFRKVAEAKDSVKVLLDPTADCTIGGGYNHRGKN